MKNNPASLCGSGIIFIAKRNVPDVSGRGNTGSNCFRYSPFLFLFNGDHCRSVTVLLERGILMLKTLVFGL